MSNKVKNINIKNRNFSFFDDIINTKKFDPNNIKIAEKSYKDILIYYTRYVTEKDPKYVKIDSINPLYFIFNEVNGCFEEINGARLKNMLVCHHHGSVFSSAPGRLEKKFFIILR